MADYWKSNPRKFCDFCKCWLADNKPSIEFHEKGRRHQNNVKRKLSEIAKKGRKDAEKQRALEKHMEIIEAAALAAMGKDVEECSDLKKFYNSSGKQSVSVKENRTDPERFPPTIDLDIKEKRTRWYQTIDSRDAQWEIPREGFLTLEEQRMVRNPAKRIAPGPPPDVRGSDAPELGKWEEVQSEKNIVEQQLAEDLQLPTQEYEFIELPVLTDDNSLEFKERSVPISTHYKSVNFRKRRIGEGQKQNLRIRKSEDD